MKTPALIVGWDIETVPQPVDALSERQQRRHRMELDAQLARRPDQDPDDASRLVRSIHPMLGRIVCISVQRMDPVSLQRVRAHSYTAPEPWQEFGMLVSVWSDLARLPRSIRWVTFGGKRFDADWMRVRSAAYGIAPTRRDILDRYPWRHDPHCDLARVFECRAGLDDLCDLLSVETPKGGAVTGATVADAVESGRIDEVAAYCEGDVAAALDCYTALAGQI